MDEKENGTKDVWKEGLKRGSCKGEAKQSDGWEGALPGCEELSHVEDAVEEGEEAGDDSGLVLAVEGAEDSGAGDSFGALVVVERGLGLRVVGVGLGLVVGAAVEKSVEVVADGSLVLRGLLGGGGE